MENIRQFVLFLVHVSLAMTLIRVYLSLNKLWKRKHDRMVAESISIIAMGLGLFTNVFLAVNFIFEKQIYGVLSSIIWILSAVFTIAVGTGLWVEGERTKGIWSLLMQALKLERDEVGDLAKLMFQPADAQEVVNILTQVALIDDVLDDREKEFIESFADSWGIDFTWDSSTRGSGTTSFIALRDSMNGYLSTSPPVTQASQLADLIKVLINIDDEVSSEEELIFAELTGLVDNYIGANTGDILYDVVVVTQTVEQEESIKTLLPDLTRKPITGGYGYFAGPFYSSRYAEIIRDEYNKLDLFAVIEREGGHLRAMDQTA